MVVIGDPDREWSVRPSTSVGPPTGSTGAGRAVAAGQRENAHLVGGRSSGVPRSAPAAADPVASGSDPAGSKAPVAPQRVRHPNDDHGADDRDHDGAQVERPLDGVLDVEDGRGDEAADQGSDDTQDDMPDHAETFVATDNHAGQVAGDRPEDDPRKKTHRYGPPSPGPHSMPGARNNARNSRLDGCPRGQRPLPNGLQPTLIRCSWRQAKGGATR